jgi:hypothetical protein
MTHARGLRPEPATYVAYLQILTIILGQANEFAPLIFTPCDCGQMFLNYEIYATATQQGAVICSRPHVLP